MKPIPRELEESDAMMTLYVAGQKMMEYQKGEHTRALRDYTAARFIDHPGEVCTLFHKVENHHNSNPRFEVLECIYSFDHLAKIEAEIRKEREDNESNDK